MAAVHSSGLCACSCARPAQALLAAAQRPPPGCHPLPRCGSLHSSKHASRGYSNALLALVQLQRRERVVAACAQPQRQQWRRPRLRGRRAPICQQGGGKGGGDDTIQNMELLIGDCLCLMCFAIYKQITALIFLPSFPGWLAPLAFNPVRFLEFFSFSATLLGTWVASGLLTGGYKHSSTSDVTTALSRSCLMWLISMPVAAAQLILLTAAEDYTLVGDEGFASALPLAASGAGEPFVTAAGVLGLMCVWRTFYAAYLDIWSFRSSGGARLDRERDMEHFADSLRGAMLLSLIFCCLLQFIAGLVGQEELEAVAASYSMLWRQ